ncbi:band 7 protein [Allomeiothermus silvanus DSM 9946]|uniref:Band 7 protein n=1 Tax=Allomeiothermus silvanus (strain ATCC 700542 / DSM 9946 / NBRC 106475 / NCIMB 13440 / VI-R2) TaxID=526227 RepID=D7BI12_ALLS1|nr:SPFH domain-containing protein [Allomeiothermus silvanus]ADH62286.1 band 7 protein [Allomeiothermus silvanus DSM 9946]
MGAIRERRAFRLNGFLAVLLVIGLFAWGGLNFYDFIRAALEQRYLWGKLAWAVGSWLLAFLSFSGFFVVQPNESRVLVFLGRYTGTVRFAGFHWANPFASKERLSLRVRNFNSERLKVNDAQGNPIEIAAVVVWRVVDTAKALFDVENYDNFVAIQSETAIRAIASRYPYDAHEGEESLRGDPDGISRALQQELQTRLEVAGVEVLEARLTHLAYAPEIAQAMLRRQQAQAVIAARQKIVEGAVGMVKQALNQLRAEGVVELDEERKAAMVNNLLVALVSESEAQPVLNTGTLY